MPFDTDRHHRAALPGESTAPATPPGQPRQVAEHTHRYGVRQRIGQVLVDQDSATPEQIRVALVEQEALRSQRLGEMLMVRQIITPQELDTAIEQQSRMPMVRIGEAPVSYTHLTLPTSDLV